MLFFITDFLRLDEIDFDHYFLTQYNIYRLICIEFRVCVCEFYRKYRNEPEYDFEWDDIYCVCDW